LDAHAFTEETENFKQTFSTRKLMAAVFWGRLRVPMVEFMPQRTTLMSEVHCKTLKNCVGTFRTKGVECWHSM
jgi:hypothetical protein